MKYAESIPLEPIQRASDVVWATFKSLYPDIFRPPRVALSNRPKSTLGHCDQGERVITLRADMFIVHSRYMLNTILPHELAHQVDFDLYGVCGDKGRHGETWGEIMLAYGLEPKRYAHYSMGRII